MSYAEPLKVLKEPSFSNAILRLLSVLENFGATDALNRPQLFRTEITFPKHDVMSVLRNSTSKQRFYWSDRERSYEWMGLGTALKISEERAELPRAMARMRALLEVVGGGAQFFGGLRFDHVRPLSDPTWSQFPDLCFVLPIVEMRSAETESSICVNVSRESPGNLEEALTILRRLQNPNEVERRNAIGYALRESAHAIVLDQWKLSVCSALSLLSTSELEKIVLANAHDMWFDVSVDPAQLLHFLNEKSLSTYRFLMQLSPDAAFVGASPEQLFARDELRVHSEAQAGTRRRGQTEAEDQALETELLQSKKEFVEHDLVFQDIENVVANLCRDSGWIDQRKIIKLSHVQHLRSRFGGILKDGIGDTDILETLHPTPAVCGRPVKMAQEEIRNLEEFDRGYYCGPIGLLGLKKTEFAVALRSAFVCGNRVRVFAGAGIVKGSNADDEWNEIESKMRLYDEVLGR